jgi:protein-L-isoaspartate(D-aspartate) O-methyltransferase
MTLQHEIRNYFNTLDRSLFMDKNKDMAHIDSPISIGYGQTISQPSLVLEMTQLLMPDKNMRTLEIGTGSGYQTALLSKFSKEVFTIERIPQLYVKAKTRLEDMGYSNIYFKMDDGTMGWPEFSPFDRIIVTAAARFIPSSLTQQLAINGRMVIPVGGPNFQELLLVTKDQKGDVNTVNKGFVRFVPLIGKYE